MQVQVVQQIAMHQPLKPSAAEKRNAPIDMQCVLCEWIHLPFRCEVFKDLSLNQRWDFVEKEGMCSRCLRKYHGSAPCINKTNNERCLRCYRHHGKTVFHNSALCSVAAGEIDVPPRTFQLRAELSTNNDDDWDQGAVGGI